MKHTITFLQRIRRQGTRSSLEQGFRVLYFIILFINKLLILHFLDQSLVTEGHSSGGQSVALGKAAVVGLLQFEGTYPGFCASFPAKAGLASGLYPAAGIVNAVRDGFMAGAAVFVFFGNFFVSISTA